MESNNPLEIEETVSTTGHPPDPQTRTQQKADELERQDAPYSEVESVAKQGHSRLQTLEKALQHKYVEKNLLTPKK